MMVIQGITPRILYNHSHSNLYVNARGTTLYLEILGINKGYYSYHSGGLVRILLENILRRYFIKVRKF